MEFLQLVNRRNDSLETFVDILNKTHKIPSVPKGRRNILFLPWTKELGWLDYATGQILIIVFFSLGVLISLLIIFLFFSPPPGLPQSIFGNILPLKLIELYYPKFIHLLFSCSPFFMLGYRNYFFIWEIQYFILKDIYFPIILQDYHKTWNI